MWCWQLFDFLPTQMVLKLVRKCSLCGQCRKCPQYCWEFHDRLWEALSGTTSEKRGVPSRTGGGENSGNALEASNSLNYRVWGIPAVLSRNSRKRSESVSGVSPEFFRNFFRKVPAVLGVWPNIGRCVFAQIFVANNHIGRQFVRVHQIKPSFLQAYTESMLRSYDNAECIKTSEKNKGGTSAERSGPT